MVNFRPEIMKQIYNFDHFSKGTIQFLLSLFLLTSGLHVDEHYHSANEGYGMCSTECDSSHHHNSEDNCEECLNNSNKQKFFIKYQTNSIYDKSNINYKEKTYSFIKNVSYHSFSSRAPPTIL